jgi:hypothetical protein
MFSFKKYLACLFITGHKPDKTHGYNEWPAKDAVCLNCGKKLK